jgi:hypothetical protein
MSYLSVCSSSQHENPDDFLYNRYDGENFGEDRTETNEENVTKLNYHSYMNRQTRVKWSKSETDLFYQVFYKSSIGLVLFLYYDPRSLRKMF